MSQPTFATFWHGDELSPYELACLLSFIDAGHDLVIYSYDAIRNLPAALPVRDAREILAPDSMQLFAVDGKPSVSHFTDYFRFVMFTKTERIWVDTDIILLKPFAFDATGNLMGRETPTSVCTAVLRLSPADPRLASMIERVEALSTRRLKWGDTGPRLLTSVYGMDEGLPERVFYPVHFDDYYKVFLAAYREECDRLCADATTLHLWNNLVVKMGLFKQIGPPKGSFLHAAFSRVGVDTLFSVSYPETVMQTMIHNAVDKLGEDAGVRKLARLVGPSLRTSIGRRWPNLVP